jgi:hypothetical protein
VERRKEHAPLRAEQERDHQPPEHVLCRNVFARLSQELRKALGARFTLCLWGDSLGSRNGSKYRASKKRDQYSGEPHAAGTTDQQLAPSDLAVVHELPL